MNDDSKDPKDASADSPADSQALPPKTMTPDKVLQIVLVVVAILGVGGYFGGRQAWRSMKVQRARVQARLAGTLLGEQRFLEAQKAVRTAVQMAPGDPEVLRAAATWCSITGRPEGLMYWDRLSEAEAPTRADLLKKLDLALTLNRVDVSRGVLKELLRTNENDREVLLRTVLHHSRSGHPVLAVQAARSAVSKFPIDPQLQLALGGLLLEFPDRGAQAEARNVLWNVALGTSEWRASAVDALSTSRLLTDGDRLLLIRSIEAREPVSLLDRLRVLDLRSAMVSDRSPLWAQAEALLAAHPGLTNRVLVVRWIGDNGGLRPAASLLPHEAARTNAFAAMAVAELCVRWRAWDGLRALLEQKPSALSPALREAAQGAMASAGGRGSDVAGHFANALQRAAGRLPELLGVATLAEEARQPDAAAKALLGAAELYPPMTVQLCRRVLELVRPMEDLSTARRTLERLGAFLPGEPSVLLERSWLDLLSSERVDRACRTLDTLVDHPGVGTDAQVMRVLADLRAGDASAAMARMEALRVEPGTLKPRLQAVCAATLLANNQPEPARRLAVRIPADQLRSKELELIAPLR